MILFTGFEPFGGDAHNPSWQAAQLAAASLSDSGVAATAVELPVEFDSSAVVLRQAIATYGPDVVIAVGLAGGTAEIAIERVAINVDDARIPDNAGFSPIDRAIVAGGPAAYFSSLPIKTAFAAVSEGGIPVRISQTAGTYVCNHVFYQLMNAAESVPTLKAGFVHVPYAAELLTDDAGNRPALPLAEIARALELIALIAVSEVEDAKITGGSLH